MYFNTGFVVILFSLVLAIAAVCPNDPPSRAKKCGKVFKRFGSVAHKDLGKLRELCPKVYGALDCLRDLMNDCEMYRNMGLSMSAELYQARKAGIDSVCGTLTNVSGGNNMVCASMLGNCVRKINSIGAQPYLICSKIGQGYACLDDLDETCSRSLAANQVNSIRQTLVPVTKMCNRQNPNTGPTGYFTEPERPNGNTVATSIECSIMMSSCGEQLSAMASVPSELCGKFPEVQSCFDNVVSSCSEVVPRDQLMQVQNSLAPIAQMCGGQGKKRGLEMECQMKMMVCGQIGAQLNTATPQTMCPILSELADCYDEVLADCSAMLPPQASAMLGSTRQQYTQICQ